VALDPRTGAVLAYVSGPADDPNAIAAGDVDPEEREQSLDRVADQVLPPGSTFKVLVSAAALAEGFDPADEFEDAAEYLAPGAGSPIGNAGDGVCGSGGTLTLTEALVVSCNTVFARLAVDLGGNAVAGTAEAAGFNAPIQWETGLVRSSIPPGSDLDADLGALAQTGIGERDVRATPLLMALIAGALGNDGVAMAPHIVDHRATGSGRIYDRTDPRAIARMFAADHAAALLEMMTAVVERGTGTAARMEGIAVAGKTGTAEGSGGPHAWFIAVAPADDPRIAIAVVVEGAGSGGRVAAPIAARVLAAWQGSDL
jgi:peptidoglycan glycosyltransferase